MDEDIARERRASRKAPEDLTAALKLAARLERAGEVGQAWQALVSAHHEGKGERLKEAASGLAGLARRNPAALFEHLGARERAPSGRLHSIPKTNTGSATPLRILAESGEVPVLVALVCNPGVPSSAAVAAAHGLRHVCSLLFHDPASRHPRAMPFPNQLREALGYLPLLPMHDDGDPFNPWRIIETARRLSVLALAPWLHVMFGAKATALATDAKLCFQELTGHPDVPLDVARLAKHWEKLRDSRGP
ncbi:hypothetical protein HY251_15305 [bacterium]|nr:hypothetical protein [bacterium]